MIEKLTKHIIHSNKPYIIFDIGSRDCLQSIEFYNAFPNAMIYAFECNPNTLDTCRKNIIPYLDRITLIEGAVCDYDGEITFHPIDQENTKSSWSDGNPGASSLFKFHDEYNKYHNSKNENYVQKTITTNCHRLDSIIKEFNIPGVDIIWMDLQGAELLALKGLGDHLKTTQYIHTEVTNCNMYCGGCNTNDILNFTKHFFENVTNIDLNLKQQDIVIINRNITIKNKTIGKPIVKENSLETIRIGEHSYPIYNDNRTMKGRIDIHSKNIGDLWRPWYFFGDTTNDEMRNDTINDICLIYDIKDTIIDLSANKVNFTSYYYDRTAKDMNYLVDILNIEEQKELIICEKQFTQNATNIDFKECKLDDLRVFEGHHRVTALEILGRHAYARIYYSYNMTLPINIQYHYNSPYTSDLWNIYKNVFDHETMSPWFKFEQFKTMTTLPKFNILMKCVEFALSHNISLDKGLDIGCAEGAYTYLFQDKLQVKHMTGLDSEPARIIRGYLAKYYYNLQNIDFITGMLEDFSYDDYDFISCLSVTHHLDNPLDTMEKICKNKKIIILENRIVHSDNSHHSNVNDVCSIRQFIDKDFTAKLAQRVNMEYKLIGNEGDRYFYVLFQKPRLFDIVIPVGPKDKDIIFKQIEYTKKNVLGYRNIYLVTNDSTLNIDGCVNVLEKRFPFDINDVANYHTFSERNGWYLQQLLKLYAGKVIRGILDHYLVIDADTFFLKPTSFFEDGLPLYNYGDEYNEPYFKHMKLLHPSFIKMEQDKSGICHHMLFNKRYVNELIQLIEDTHDDDFYNVFLKFVDYIHAGASEYELYFNYMLKNHSDKIKIRKLNWENVSALDTSMNCHYISYHWYKR